MFKKLFIIFIVTIVLSTLYAEKNPIIEGKLWHEGTCNSINFVLSKYTDEELKNVRMLQIQYSVGYDFKSPGINKIEGLERLPNLNSLIITTARIDKIEGLEKYTKLEYLDLTGNRIKKIEGLDNLRNLKELNLEGNIINKIEGLENLRNLENLNLANNQILKIENLDNLTNLKRIALDQNNIEKIENIRHLKQLNIFSFLFNPIKYIDNEMFNFLKGMGVYYSGNGSRTWFTKVYKVKVNKIYLYDKISSGKSYKDNAIRGNVNFIIEKETKLSLMYIFTSDTIDGIKGNWFQVRTEQGEIGWCFSGYLEELK